ncbi:MAG TPA: amidohydrolase [Metalysinibacillus jejuensis]|uniref:Amidohydrolase n=1 Tax=Metalysinibacillus jejuensis TaxID=914327 RepID=A0A921T4E1_9BACL|nr:amidohydrolase [Metalysinibacillus jejuensis]HJH10442.1 amidohydrolase [Metalysinibacillus jejuensis]
MLKYEQVLVDLATHFTEMVDIRRYLHQYPEVSYNEIKTAHYIANYYKDLPYEVRTEVGGRGIVAILKGDKPGPTVALRADFDALAIEEQTGLPFASKVPGVMHACGHDAHTATLLVIARVLAKHQSLIEGTIVLIHQFAEEISPGGAIAMIEDGCLEGVDAIFGTHIWATEELGHIRTKAGPIMAAADGIDIIIQGRGGHGSEPHLTKDAVLTAAQFITNAQQIVSRRINPLHPAVVSIGNIVAENPFNVIADCAVLSGTVRTFDEDTRQQIKAEIDKVLYGVCAMTEATYRYTYTEGYPALVNHEHEATHILQVAALIDEVTNVSVCEPYMSGEDFAYYTQHIPGAYFFTGAKPLGDTTYPHHHPKFDIDERAMLIAAKTLCLAALTYEPAN